MTTTYRHRPVTIYRLACDSEIQPGKKEVVWTYLPSRSELRTVVTATISTSQDTKIDIKDGPYRAIVTTPGRAPEHWVIEEISLIEGASIDQAVAAAETRTYLISGSSRIADVNAGPAEEKLTPVMIAERLGIQRVTWNSYHHRGTCPSADGYFGPLSPYWLESTIDEYARTRRSYRRRG